MTFDDGLRIGLIIGIVGGFVAHDVVVPLIARVMHRLHGR